ncbi:MAG TPA: pentapeptide repeat-containing protein [Oligoflexus sp.]|uniref:pentapeptide repeat-containing protein n=1 Tax=Oligoflexus sp. TaxID=1971216 RepID=UPI002D45194A|nr:pentapeptide repeat-containing protein [Oligoflexus sp.]HYX31847.1 pentapeptide repeat-containing protein [Oligoflexus sp.]
MFRSLLAVLLLSVISGACSSASLRGKSANGSTTSNPDNPSPVVVPSPFPALTDCQSTAPARLCGLASLAPELQIVDSLKSAQTLQGIRLTSRRPDEQAWQDLTLNASCLSENSFVDAQWDRSVFQGSEMIITELSRTSWNQARFVDSDLRLSHFALANFVELTVQNSCLASINWSASRFQDVTMDNSSAERGNFSGIVSQGRFDFTRGQLSGSNFSGAVFEGPVNFQDTNLRGVDLSAVKFNDTVNWQGAQLSGATWMDGRICAEGSVGQCD